MWNLLREGVRLKSEVAEAIPLYQEFLPQLDEPSIAIEFARSLEFHGHYGEAIDLYRMVVNAFPTSAEAHRDLARLLNEQRPLGVSIDSIIEVAEKAVNLDEGEHINALILLAELQMEASRHKDAINSLEALISTIESDSGLGLDLNEIRFKLMEQRKQLAKSRDVQQS